MDAERHSCSDCGREFQNAESLGQHRQAKHAPQPATPKPKRKSAAKIVLIFAIILIVAGLYLAFKSSSRNGTGPEGIPTAPIHWHPHVTILIKGQQVNIPANVGLSPVEMPVHTHEPDNIIHWEVQRPTAENMQLGYFFNKVWNKTFNSTCIFDNCNGPGGTVKMLVNGIPNTEFDRYMPKDKDEIRIVFE